MPQDPDKTGAATDAETPSDAELAFGAPDVRAAATAPGAVVADRISLRDHVIEAEVGAFQEERGRRQRLAFNVAVEVAPQPEAGQGDDVDRILSYDTITEAISAGLAAGRVDLLETLAERICALILAAPLAQRVFLRIEKLDRGPGALGVEIARRRGEIPAAAAAAVAPPKPMIVQLSAEAADSAFLPGWLDTLQARGGPVVLVPPLPSIPRPVSAAPSAQRRIDLLALEQAAWQLAGRDRRCLVVASRTELDWAARQGRIVVWAPSKLVLDSPRGAAADPTDPAGLALWLAAELAVAELHLVGAAAAGHRSDPIPIWEHPVQEDLFR